KGGKTPRQEFIALASKNKHMWNKYSPDHCISIKPPFFVCNSFLTTVPEGKSGAVDSKEKKRESRQSKQNPCYRTACSGATTASNKTKSAKYRNEIELQT
ncbi:hypothetical protein CU098_006654, partial [Rhizopus stolonifer]